MKTYLVTDPCYIVPNDVWGKAIDKMWNSDGNEIPNGRENYEKVLSEYVGAEVKTSNTGYGDWTNYLKGEYVKSSEFCADAGEVCVVEATPKILEILKNKYNYSLEEPKSLAALFEVEDNAKVNVRFITDDLDWTAVCIDIEDSTGYHYISSIDSDEYRFGEDDYEDYCDCEICDDYEDYEDYEEIDDTEEYDVTDSD